MSNYTGLRTLANCQTCDGHQQVPCERAADGECYSCAHGFFADCDRAPQCPACGGSGKAPRPDDRVFMRDQNGERVPGVTSRAKAERARDEYAEKLGEHWTIEGVWP